MGNANLMPRIFAALQKILDMSIGQHTLFSLNAHFEASYISKYKHRKIEAAMITKKPIKITMSMTIQKLESPSGV